MTDPAGTERLTDDERLARAYDDGYNDAATMARCYGHTDHWENEPENPYRARAVSTPPAEPLAFGYLRYCEDGAACTKPGCLLAHGTPPAEPAKVSVQVNDLRAILQAANYMSDRTLIGPVDRMSDALALVAMKSALASGPTAAEPATTGAVEALDEVERRLMHESKLHRTRSVLVAAAYEDGAAIVREVRAAVSAGQPDRCECVGYTIRTDYGTGTEHDVDRSSCPVHGQPDAGDTTLDEVERKYRLAADPSTTGIWRESVELLSSVISEVRAAVSARQPAVVECRWCPLGCPSCEPNDCECYRHQDWTDKTTDPAWPYRDHYPSLTISSGTIGCTCGWEVERTRLDQAVEDYAVHRVAVSAGQPGAGDTTLRGERDG